MVWAGLALAEHHDKLSVNDLDCCSIGRGVWNNSIIRLACLTSRVQLKYIFLFPALGRVEAVSSKFAGSFSFSGIVIKRFKMSPGRINEQDEYDFIVWYVVFLLVLLLMLKTSAEEVQQAVS
jgi:hypothetical protein